MNAIVTPDATLWEQASVGDAEQRQALVEFNFNPLRHLDASWIPQLPHAAVIERLQANERCHPWLSDYLLQLYGQQGHYDFDCSEPGKNLLLLSRATTRGLIRKAGIAVNAPVIRTEINNRMVKMIKQTIGPVGYDFAIRRCGLLLPTPPAYVLKADVVGEPAWKLHGCTPETLGSYFDHCGLRIWAAAIGHFSMLAKRRVLWKLPFAYQTWTRKAFPLADDTARRQSAQRTLTRLLQEKTLPCSTMFS